MRIAIGGFQHETNTFAPSKATYLNFERAKGWPGLQRGGEMLETMVARNLPIAGQMKGTRHTLVPTAWAAAEPSAHVTEDAFERIAAMIVDGIRDAKPDAVYLDLHGAMVTEHLDDGEGEILARVRRAVGEDVPVMASLDLHANVTRTMVDCADALVGYRTYPHVDMADTGARTAFLLAQRLDGMARPHAALRRIPFLIPLSAQCTDLEPSKKLFADLAGMETRDVPTLSFTPGFPAADFPECGPVVLAYGTSPGAAAQAADALARHIESIEAEFDAPVYAADEAVKRAMAIAAKATRPVVIADTQDNPGAGGDSDTTGMLRALLANNVQRAALGVMVDPAAAEAAHRAGIGSRIELSLGGKSGVPGDAPLRAQFRVDALSDGRLLCKGPFYRGAKMELGLSACLSIEGVRIVLASKKTQLADQELYRFVGIEPTAQAILVNKSSVHFRADFAPIAEQILVAKAPGPMIADPSEFPWKRLARGIRLKPNGKAF
jgi:microcystin degradation protein MlrC